MAYDKTQPISTTKIRNLSTVIPDNFEAISSADATFKPNAINYADRTADIPLDNDPTVIPASVIAYCKQDGSANPQLYAIDPSTNITQITGSSFTETTNAGTAGGTLYKVVWTMFPGNTIVFYGGLTDQFSGSRTITLPQAYDTLYSAWCTPRDGTANPVSFTSGNTTTITIHTSSALTISWGAIVKI